jgi:DNA-binding CsgD family transcriptional regulator
MSAMASELTLERVRRDVEVISRAGLDTATFMTEFNESVSRAVPNTATCLATFDPATTLLTSTYKFGELAGNDANDHEWGLVEYGENDPSAFVPLASQELPAVAVEHDAVHEASRSLRLEQFIEPTYGFRKELRMVGRKGNRGWGGLAMFREADDHAFSPAEIEFVGSLSADFAAGVRSGLLVRTAGAPVSDRNEGPRVVIVGADNRIGQISVGAEAILRDLARDPHLSSADGIIGSLVASARRYAAGTEPVLPRARVRMPSGCWLVLHASPLASVEGASGDVVITMEEARPPEIVPLIVAAFDLTARERDVTQLVIQGVETKEIAATLHMSRYTVQDHLKSVFDKADVRSRRELLSRIFFDQYVPRMGADLAPSGWFTPT